VIEREQHENVALVKMVRGKGNAMNIDFLRALIEELDALEQSSARAVVLTGTGSVFSAGVDLVQLTQAGGDYIREFLASLLAFFDKLFVFPKPFISAVNGHAIAGGCIVCLESDYRIMACGPGKIGLTELAVGVPFPPLVLEIVRMAVAPQAFPKVVNLGLLFSPEEALELGLLDEVVDPPKLLDRSLEVAAKLAHIPNESFRLTKLGYRHTFQASADHGGTLYNRKVVEAWSSAEVHQAIAAFIAKNIKKS
jgi:enoyl-CoA hydratase